MEKRKLLTSTGRLLAILAKNGGKVRFGEARKYVGTQIYAAARQGILEGWLRDNGQELELVDEELLKIGGCLAECILE